MKPDEKIEKTLLSNGVRILSQRMPHVQSVSMGVWVSIGSRDETNAENGLSHFIEHMMFKGTQKRSAFEIAKAFDAIGGYTNAFTSMENTCYHAKVMANHLDTMSEILTDIFLNSLFDEAEIEKERPVIFQEIGMMEDTPDEYVHQLAVRTFFKLVRSMLPFENSTRAFRLSFPKVQAEPLFLMLAGSSALRPVTSNGSRTRARNTHPFKRLTHPEPWKPSDSAGNPSPALTGPLSPFEGERDGERGPTSIAQPAPTQARGSGGVRLIQVVLSPVPLSRISWADSPSSSGAISTCPPRPPAVAAAAWPSTPRAQPACRDTAPQVP